MKKKAKKKTATRSTAAAATRTARASSAALKSGRKKPAKKTAVKKKPAAVKKSSPTKPRKNPAAAATVKKKKTTARRRSKDSPTSSRQRKNSGDTTSAEQKSKPSSRRSSAPTRKRSGRNTKTDPSSSTRRADPSRDTAYELHKERQRERSADQTRRGQDIGPLPKPANPKRRAKCEKNLAKFLTTYFPDVFVHPWSRVHLKLIKLTTMAVLAGIMLAMAIPRGFGKTSLCVRAVIWAIAYKHHRLVMLLAATNDAAEELITDIHAELTENELLCEDFPELCIPIREVGSANQKGRGQRCDGKATKVKVRARELWTGDIGGEIGACIWACGITAGGIRGKRRTVKGKVLRPTLGLGDDCQTRSSAISDRGITRRKNILEADLPGLPGQSNSWSFLSTWTVIEADDVADWVTDRTKAPDYHGVRERFLDSLPSSHAAEGEMSAMDHWQRWNEIRIRCQQSAGIDFNKLDIDNWEDELFEFEEVDPLEPAHAYYDQHREEMEDGADVVWEHAFDPNCYRSALEKAMHWYFRNRLAFFSELQNDPGAAHVDTKPQLVKFDVAERMGGHERGRVPTKAQWLTIGMDVQLKCLFWSVRAWAQDSTSWVIDYGAWPGQSRHYFSLSDIRLTIDAVYSKLPTWDARLARALKDLLDNKFGEQYQREDGLALGLTAGGIDANYETKHVKAAVAASGYYGRIYPTHGHSFAPPNTPINETAAKDRDIIGDGWRLRAPREGDIQHVLFDSDTFKSFERDRLLMDPLQPGALVLPDGPAHDMWADHHCAERSTEITNERTKRTVDVWKLLPHKPDNHFFDVEVINNVVGSMIGCRLPVEGVAQPPAAAVAAMPTSAHHDYQPFGS